LDTYLRSKNYFLLRVRRYGLWIFFHHTHLRLNALHSIIQQSLSFPRVQAANLLAISGTNSVTRHRVGMWGIGIDRPHVNNKKQVFSIFFENGKKAISTAIFSVHSF